MARDEQPPPSWTERIILIVVHTARDEQPPPSWTRRIMLIGIVSGLLAVLSALAWPTIERPLGLDASNLSRFWVAIIVAATFSVTCLLVYFVAKKSLWEFLDLLIVPLALAIIAVGFTAQQQARQAKIETKRYVRAQAVEEQRAQNAALQAYLDQMNHLILDRKLLKVEQGDPVHDPGDPVHTLAQARTTTAISQFDGENNQAVTRFLSDSGLLREPALLAKTDLQDARLPKAVLEEANLAGTQLNRADLAEAVLIGADFYAKEKVGEDIRHIIANLTRANLRRAALQEANLAECTLDKATLTEATLQGADLSSASLQGANVTKAALQSADLSSAESTADLEDAPLRFLKERSTNLTDANLSHATLQRADLSSAILQNANLTDAVLTDANLTDAYLSDADLSEVRGWTMEQLTAARSLKGATMPDGQTLKSDKMPHKPTFE
jgi:uncharacterized protein YjbI with pentapeptide repeats